MKESTYLDLTPNQVVALTDAITNKYCNLHDKYEQLDTLKKYYEDEIGKIDSEIKKLETDLSNTARGILPIKVNKGRLNINATKSAISEMIDVRKLEDIT